MTNPRCIDCLVQLEGCPITDTCVKHLSQKRHPGRLDQAGPLLLVAAAPGGQWAHDPHVPETAAPRNRPGRIRVVVAGSTA